MIQQVDIDDVKNLDLPQPVSIASLQINQYFSLVPNPVVFYKVLDFTEENVFARAISGVYKNTSLTFPLTASVWVWKEKSKDAS